MVDFSRAASRRPIHPIHAILLSFALPLSLGALVSDLAYRATLHVQWANFSSWLIAGSLFVTAFAVIWALVNVFARQGGAGASRSRNIAYFVALLAMWIIGFVNALIHAKDAWATMPEGVFLSLVATVLALIASWLGFSGSRFEEGH